LRLKAVLFDVGETLVDETRVWAGWAEWLGIPALTLFGVLGGTVARGEDHRRTFEILGVDLDREWAAREAAGDLRRFEPQDLYPDVIPCLQALKSQGYVLAAAGNHSSMHEEGLRGLGLDAVSSSQSLGAEKPSMEFFIRLAELAGVRPEEAAYVGDRIDNDVTPTLEAGMIAVFLRRGPWAHLQSDSPAAANAHARIESLFELSEALAGVNGSR